MIHPTTLYGGFMLIMSAMYVFPNGVQQGMDPTLPPSGFEAGRMQLDQSDTAEEIVAYVSFPQPLGFSDILSNSPVDSSKPININQGWRPVFSGNGQESNYGSMKNLIDLSQVQAPIAVEIPTFHGPVAAVCLDTYETDDGDIACEVEFWCDGPAKDTIPAHHEHIAIVRSNGEVQQAVATLNERQEEKIAQMRYTVAHLNWFTR